MKSINPPWIAVCARKFLGTRSIVMFCFYPRLSTTALICIIGASLAWAHKSNISSSLQSSGFQFEAASQEIPSSDRSNRQFVPVARLPSAVLGVLAAYLACMTPFGLIKPLAVVVEVAWRVREGRSHFPKPTESLLDILICRFFFKLKLCILRNYTFLTSGSISSRGAEQQLAGWLGWIRNC